MHLVVHCSTSRVPKQGISVSKSSVLGRPDPFPDLNHQTIFQEPLDESMIKCDITYKIGLRLEIRWTTRQRYMTILDEITWSTYRVNHHCWLNESRRLSLKMLFNGKSNLPRYDVGVATWSYRLRRKIQIPIDRPVDVSCGWGELFWIQCQNVVEWYQIKYCLVTLVL